MKLSNKSISSISGKSFVHTERWETPIPKIHKFLKRNCYIHVVY